MLKQMPESEYRAHEGVSQSFLKDVLSLSGRELQHKMKNPTQPSEKMIKGTMAHAIALEGQQVCLEGFAIDRWPSLTGNSRTKKGIIDGVEMGYQAYKKQLIATGKTMMREEEIVALEGVAASIETSFGRFFKEGNPEISMIDVEIEGVKAKGMIDFEPPEHFLFDLKITSKKLDDKQMRNFLYFDRWLVQAAFYVDLYEKITGEARDFLFFVAADYAPYPTRKMVVQFDSEGMDHGRKLYKEGIAVFRQLLEFGDDLWPNYPAFIAD